MSVVRFHHRVWPTVVAVLGLLLGLLVLSPPARAGAPPPAYSSAEVNQLPLVNGYGRIVVQVKVVDDLTVGFSVEIPAGSGSWQTAADIVVPGSGVHCLGVPGANLRYACGHAGFYAPPAPAIAPGDYTVSLPARRIGTWTGLVGNTSVYQEDSSETAQIESDTFPVLDGSVGPRSNAQVRLLTTTSYLHGAPTTGDLAVTVTVLDGETPTTALDVRMPSGMSWTITRVAGGGHLICSVRSAPGQSDFLHCANLVAGLVSPFPVGVFTLVLGVSGVLNTEFVYRSPRVAVSYADGGSQFPDTFLWFH